MSQKFVSAVRRHVRSVQSLKPSTLVAFTLMLLPVVAHAQGTMDFSGAQTLMGTFNWRNDYAGIEQWSRFIRDDHYAFHAELHRQHEQFAKVWDKNLRDQGFVEAFEQQRDPRA